MKRLSIALTLLPATFLALSACDSKESDGDSATESSETGMDSSVSDSGAADDAGGADDSNGEVDGDSASNSDGASDSAESTQMSTEAEDSADTQSEVDSGEEEDSSNPQDTSTDDTGMDEDEGGDDDANRPTEGCEAFNDPGFVGSVEVGKSVPHVESLDRHGETFKLCDNAGKIDILVDLSTGWCEPCKEFARYISTGQGSYPPVKPVVDAGRIQLVVYIAEDTNKTAGFDQNPVPFLQSWYNAYPHDKVVVAYAPQEFVDMFAVRQGPITSIGYPNYALINKEFVWETKGEDESLGAASRR